MKFFQKFELCVLTKKERLAEYESEIAYNQSVIENAETSILEIQKIIKSISKHSKKNPRTNELLLGYLNLIDEHKHNIENSKANLRYFEVLRDNLKKELESQNS